MRMVTDAERRSRLARRHGLAPGHHYPSVDDATRGMTALHATEAATVHLALQARVNDVTIDDVEHALYRDKTLVKQIAMRRTLWAFPRDLLPQVWGSAAARTAVPERKKLVKYTAEAGLADAEAWVAQRMDDVVALLADGEPRTTQTVRKQLPGLDTRFTIGDPSKKWGGSYPVGPRILTTLGAEGRVMRAENDGHWRLNRPTWTTTRCWLGDHPEPTTSEDGYAELVRRWLWTFGPGTETDVVWWLGATKGAVRAALATTGAVEVALEDDQIGYVLPDDPVLDGEEEPVEPWAALLPTLDPTVMGWKDRRFYLDPADRPYLFDSNGNAGNTAWWNGRIVGAWLQDDDGVVRVVTRTDVGRAGEAALEVAAEQLTEWLDGTRIVNVYASTQMKQAALP